MEIINQLNESLDCVLYVDASEPITAAYLDDFFREKDFLNSYDNIPYTIVSTNNDKDYTKKSDQENGFLFYSSYVEVISFKNIDQPTFLTRLQELINFLRSKGIATTPSCEFEQIE
jgi:effector-binding domain-containing protein